MARFQKTLKVSGRDFLIKHLKIINAIIPHPDMTNKEIEVLAALMSADEDRFSTESRKRVMEELNLSPSGLSNYIRDLTDKKIMKDLEGTNYKIAPFFELKDKQQQDYILTLLRT